MRDGGTFMWVILLVWLTGLGLSFYKYIILKSSDINGNKLVDGRLVEMEDEFDERQSGEEFMSDGPPDCRVELNPSGCVSADEV